MSTIKIGLILLCSFFMGLVSVRTPDLNGRYYNPISLQDDLYFEIEAISMKNLLDENILKAKVYYWKGYYELVIDKNNFSKELQKKIEDQLKAKVRIVIGFDFKTWISPYKFYEEKNNKFTYLDETGLLENEKIEVIINKNKIEIIETKSSGQVKTNYNYQEKEWSSGKQVLGGVEKSIHEYSDKIFVNTKLKYQLFDKRWFVSEIEVQTKQKIIEKLITPIERVIDEIFLIKNLKFNQGVSQKWFSKK